MSVGTFDGVHLGHADLMTRARRLADAHPESCRVVAMCFSPHPKALLEGQSAPVELTPFDDRAELLRQAGADEVLQLRPDAALLSLDPEAFVRERIMPLSPVAMVEGPDFRFGKRRLGDVKALAALGEGLGFSVEVASPASSRLIDGTETIVSSTTIRHLLSCGRVGDASLMLGRPHELSGTVVRGDRRGRTIGFPTANLEPIGAVPGDGVYACTATLPGGRIRSAAVNIGTRPTFDGLRRMVETHLLDTESSEDGSIRGMDEYGWDLRLRFIARVRDQVRFGSAESLVAQLSRDLIRVRSLASTLTQEQEVPA